MSRMSWRELDTLARNQTNILKKLDEIIEKLDEIEERIADKEEIAWPSWLLPICPHCDESIYPVKEKP